MRSTIFTVLSALLLATEGSAFMVSPNHQMAATTRVYSTSLLMSDGVKKTGTVKWFNTLKGYGFIVPDDGGADIFVHQTEIQTQGFRSLADGEAVEFVAAKEGNGKMKATKVTGPGGAQVQGAPFRPQNDDFDQ